ncbi:MAG TPA: TolC family protein, partial [Chthonomonadales bacterium]|nr:TolC family protein [Chthonomonadales bacterium]
AHFGRQTIPILPQFNPVITAQASLPLDLVGTLHAATTQAQFQEVAARIAVNQTRNQLVLDVKTAFYNALRAQAQTRVAADTLNNALSRWENAQKNYAAGISPRFDVITSQSDVAAAQQSLIQARSQVSLVLASLKNVIGISIRVPVSITDAGAIQNPPGVAPPALPKSAAAEAGAPNQPPAQVQGASPAKANLPPKSLLIPEDLSQPPSNTGVVSDPLDLGSQLDPLLKEALATRPEILAADANLAAARKGVVVARRSELPSFSVSLGYTYTPNAVGFTLANQEAATLNASFPIFDGGLAAARVKESRAGVASAETARRTAIDQVSLDVQQAYLALLQARDRVQVANVALTQAREAARLAMVRYNAGVSQQAGVSPILEVSNAQTSLSQAEANQVNALYDYNSARAQLDRAIGRYSYTGAGPGYPAPPSAATTGAKGNPPASPAP